MNEMKKPINWLILLLLAVGTVLILRHDALGGSSAARGTFHTNRGYIFGTVYKTTYQYKTDIQPLIEARLHDVDNSLSPFNDHSVITRINNGQDMQTDSLFRTVWRKADEVWRLTGGAFDITCAPLVNAWGFGFRTSAFPDSTACSPLSAWTRCGSTAPASSAATRAPCSTAAPSPRASAPTAWQPSTTASAYATI